MDRRVCDLSGVQDTNPTYFLPIGGSRRRGGGTMFASCGIPLLLRSA